MTDNVFSIPAPTPVLAGKSRPKAADPSAPLGRYIAGSENGLVENVFDCLPVGPAPYNPLVFVGSKGTGKSLLCTCLAARWLQQEHNQRPLVTTGASFAREYRHATQTDSLIDLRKKYRSTELLIIDDLHQTRGKQGAQIELLHTIDFLLEHGRWFVATLKHSSDTFGGFLPGLASRLSGGLTVPLVPPGPAARRTILQHLAEYRDVTVSDKLLDILVDLSINGAAPSVAELDAAIQRLERFVKEQPEPCDEERVRAWLVAHSTSKLELGSVVREVSKYFRLKASDLRGPARQQSIVQARGIAMLLARRLTNHSLDQVGRHFGNRDHTTVLHACRKTESLIRNDPIIRRAVDELTGLLLAT